MLTQSPQAWHFSRSILGMSFIGKSVTSLLFSTLSAELSATFLSRSNPGHLSERLLVSDNDAVTFHPDGPFLFKAFKGPAHHFTGCADHRGHFLLGQAGCTAGAGLGVFQQHFGHPTGNVPERQVFHE